MNSIPNTFFLRTFKIKGYAILIVVVFVSFITGYMVNGLHGNGKGERGQLVEKNGEIYLKLPDQERSALKVFTFDLPEKLEFAGEPVPLHIPDVFERFDYELHLNTYFHSSTISLIKKANRWLPVMTEILRKNNIPEDFKYLPLIESGLENVVSSRQAVGYWQIRSETAKELGLEVNDEVDERYDPIKSTEAACKYLWKAYEKFGNWTSVAASYNVGMRGLEDRIKEQGVTSYYDLLINQETARYLFRIMAIKEIIENPQKYGYDVPHRHLYTWTPTQIVQVDHSISNLADFAKEQGINYKILKRFNPWLRRTHLNVRKGKVYDIQIPVVKTGWMTGEI
jgi:membrane-bound lytic murein transglycosylase D